MSRRYIVLRDRHGNETRMPDPSGLDVPVLGFDDEDERPLWVEAPSGEPGPPGTGSTIRVDAIEDVEEIVTGDGLESVDNEDGTVTLNVTAVGHTTHDAADVDFDNTSSGLVATDVQAAIDEHLGDHPSGGSGAAVLPLTAVVNGDPVLVWDANGSLIPVEV